MIKIKFSIVLAAFFCLFIAGNVFCQTDDGNLKTAVLQARISGGDNYADSVFSFEKGVNGKSGQKITLNKWDLHFVSLRRYDGSVEKHIFEVCASTDDRSRIKDLGELNWDDDFTIPELPVFDDLRGIGISVNPEHIYLVHTKNKETDFLAIFRVDDLKFGESVKISWKLMGNPPTK